MVSLRCFAFFDKCYGMYRISSFFENKKKFYSSLMDFIFILFFFALSTINTIPHPPLSLTPKIIKKKEKKKRKKGGTYARVCCGKRDEGWRRKEGKEGKIIQKSNKEKKKKKKTEEKKQKRKTDKKQPTVTWRPSTFIPPYFCFFSFSFFQ